MPRKMKTEATQNQQVLPDCRRTVLVEATSVP
jgi:hypothetical protein